jgi:hypothetical protein
MAHYAFLDENNIVVEVIPGRNEDEIVDGISDWESHYAEVRGLRCKRTSYNTYGGVNPIGTAFRKNYGMPGYTYDEERDAFIAPKRFPSWVIDEETCLWVPPIKMPNDDNIYVWKEESISWEIAP